MNNSNFPLGIMAGALLTALASLLAATMRGPSPTHVRACRAELKLAPTARDTLAVVLKDETCAKYVLSVPAPQEPQ